ncbi:hypothetical protein [Streptomyces luteocolor]|uniref:hypothetical protein n=1 Tax=Streptomyces luteocolor TaxID=285500 RepID=UPI000853D29D|nr:hypothetical protein [Streptomyces luteocolor]
MSEFRSPVHSSVDAGVAHPARPTWQLVLRFAVSTVVLPVWWVVWIGLALVIIAFAMLTEFLTYVIQGYERGIEHVMDATLGKMPVWPRWSVTWPELRHEGDTEFYRTRVDKWLAERTKRVSAPRSGGTPKQPREHEIGLKHYRGVGSAYAVRAATDLGWELRPSDPAKEIALRWPH